MKLSRIFLNTLMLNLTGSIGFAGLLLALRIGMTHNFFFSFLVWNLFLAAVPFMVTRCLLLWGKERIAKGWLFLGLGLWLLFFPNSPYIITDLVHLQNERSILPWYDLFLVFVFAFNGLLLGMLSLWDVYRLLQTNFTEKVGRNVLFVACFLSGYGIYLGRFLRFNSWDVVTKPLILLEQMAYSFQELKTWYITLAFGGFLWILFSLVRSLVPRNLTVSSNNYD